MLISVSALALVGAMAGQVSFLGTSEAYGPPSTAVDEAVVPHYFGPWPNWANSQFTLPKATVTISGTGQGATAIATVNPVNGGIAGIEVTNPGRGYGAVTDPPTPTTVTITDSRGTGLGDGATASALVTTSGSVVGFDPAITGGSGYKELAVTLVGGGGGSGATAIATGSLDAVTLTDGGCGYTMPTVDFDFPDSPDGVQATGSATVDNGVITSVTIENPGSGYISAPGVNIRNGTAYDPIALDCNGQPGTPAQATSTLTMTGIYVDQPGQDYTSPPQVVITDATGTGDGASATAQVAVGAISGISLDAAGTGYLQQGIRKFVDPLPMLCDPAAGGCPTDATQKHLPIAVPE